MDLGIRGRTAIVCAASKGLGRACAFSLAREGVKLVITARGREALDPPRPVDTEIRHEHVAVLDELVEQDRVPGFDGLAVWGHALQA